MLKSTMFRPVIAQSALFISALAVFGCSSKPAPKTTVFQTGDRAAVDKLNYNVVDTQIFNRLGEDPNVRIPQNRFYVVQISVFNSGSQDAAIPAMTLVDDGRKTYEELTDGSGVARWLGVVRHVAPNQTETGTIIFDAPASHYKLRLTDDTDENEVYIDIPLSFAHEQLIQTDVPDAPAVPGADSSAPPLPKKK